MTEQSQRLIEQRISAESFSFYWIIIDLDVSSSIHSERFTRRLCNGKMNLFSIWGNNPDLACASNGSTIDVLSGKLSSAFTSSTFTPVTTKAPLEKASFLSSLRVFFFSELLEQNIANSTQYTLASLSWKMQRQTIPGNLRKRCRKSSNWIIPRLLKAFKLSLPQ